jgi:outer membrane protein TolC
LQSKDLAVNGEAVPLTNTYSQDLQQALATRPELQQLTSAATALEGLERVNASNYFPNLALFGSYGWQEDKLKFSPESDYVAAGVQLRWNLFSGFGDRAKVAENEAQIVELEFQKENVQNGIRIEVQNARLEVENTKERYITAMKQLKSAEENRRITKAQYDAGIAPLITMIDAETTLANSKASLTVATYDEMLAEAKYRKALGLR